MSHTHMLSDDHKFIMLGYILISSLNKQIWQGQHKYFTILSLTSCTDFKLSSVQWFSTGKTQAKSDLPQNLIHPFDHLWDK